MKRATLRSNLSQVKYLRQGRLQSVGPLDQRIWYRSQPTTDTPKCTGWLHELLQESLRGRIEPRILFLLAVLLGQRIWCRSQLTTDRPRCMGCCYAEQQHLIRSVTSQRLCRCQSVRLLGQRIWYRSQLTMRKPSHRVASYDRQSDRSRLVTNRRHGR